MTKKINSYEFSDPSKLTNKELNEIIKLSEHSDLLDKLNKNQLKELKKSLEKELKGYLSRSTNEKSKEWVKSMVDKIISNIDNLLTNTQGKNANESKNLKKDIKEENKEKDENKNLRKDVVKENKEQNKTNKEEKSNKKTNEGVVEMKAENKNELKLAHQKETEFNKRLEKLLDEKTTLIFKVGNKALLMKFDTPDQKATAEKLFANIEKTYGNNDKQAAYAVLEFLHEYKDNILLPEDIYKKAAEGLYGNQIVLTFDKKQTDLALLDAAKNKDIKVIDIDTGNPLVDAVISTFTLGLGGDTASVSKDKLQNDDYGEKATAESIYNGYHTTVNDKEITLQEPLKHFEKSEVLDDLTNEMEDLLTKLNDNELKVEELESEAKSGNIVAQLVIEYLTDNAVNLQSLPAVELKGKFMDDDTIKSWIKENKVLDKYTTKDDVITITKDGFISFDHVDELSKAKYVKALIEGVGENNSNKEVLMEVGKLGFKDIGVPEQLAEQLRNYPPIILQDGSIISFTKEGIYVLGKKVGNTADEVKDYIRNHPQASAAIAGGIIGGLTVALLDGTLKLPKINLSGVEKFLKSIGHNVDNFFNSIEKGVKNGVDAIRSLDITKLDAAVLGYVFTALPLNYRIALLENKLAEVKGKYEGSDAINAELKALMNKEINVSLTEITKYNEAANEYAHYILVKEGIFKPGEATSLVFNKAVKTDKGYELTATEGTLKLGEKTFTLDSKDGDYFTIYLNKEGKISNFEGKFTEEVFGKDNILKINNTNVDYIITHTFGKNEEKKNITFDDIRNMKD